VNKRLEAAAAKAREEGRSEGLKSGKDELKDYKSPQQVAEEIEAARKEFANTLEAAKAEYKKDIGSLQGRYDKAVELYVQHEREAGDARAEVRNLELDLTAARTELGTAQQNAATLEERLRVQAEEAKADADRRIAAAVAEAEAKLAQAKEAAAAELAGAREEARQQLTTAGEAAAAELAGAREEAAAKLTSARGETAALKAQYEGYQAGEAQRRELAVSAAVATRDAEITRIKADHTTTLQGKDAEIARLTEEAARLRKEYDEYKAGEPSRLEVAKADAVGTASARISALEDNASILEQQLRKYRGDLEAVKTQMSEKISAVTLSEETKASLTNKLENAQVTVKYTPNGFWFDTAPTTFYSGNRVGKQDEAPSVTYEKTEYTPEQGTRHVFKVEGTLYEMNNKGTAKGNGVAYHMRVYARINDAGQTSIDRESIEMTVENEAHAIFSMPTILNADTPYANSMNKKGEHVNPEINEEESIYAIEYSGAMYDTKNSGAKRGKPKSARSEFTLVVTND
jgi:hypothetical protein